MGPACLPARDPHGMALAACEAVRRGQIHAAWASRYQQYSPTTQNKNNSVDAILHPHPRTNRPRTQSPTALAGPLYPRKTQVSNLASYHPCPPLLGSVASSTSLRTSSTRQLLQPLHQLLNSPGPPHRPSYGPGSPIGPPRPRCTARARHPRDRTSQPRRATSAEEAIRTCTALHALHMQPAGRPALIYKSRLPAAIGNHPTRRLAWPLELASCTHSTCAHKRQCRNRRASPNMRMLCISGLPASTHLPASPTGRLPASCSCTRDVTGVWHDPLHRPSQKKKHRSRCIASLCLPTCPPCL